ncbi:MAG: hypothetical protein AABX63_05775 [Nanoarchaeota archaeon]
MKAEMEKYKIAGIILVAVLAFFYFILGLDGMMSVLGIFLLFIVPMHFILGNFGLEEDEKLVYSFFIGAGILPSLAYWIGLFISFKMAILVAFIALLAVGAAINHFKQFRKQ